MVDQWGTIDYDKIKEKILDIINQPGFKVIVIDSSGNAVSDILNKFQFDINNFLRVGIANFEVMTPANIQDHKAEAVTLFASGTRSASGNGSDVDVGRFIIAEICIDVTNVSGTFATGEGLRVYIEGKDEISGKYKTIYDSYADLGSMITSPTTLWVTVVSLAFRLIRVRYEITGTNPAFTFGVYMQGKA